MMESHHNSTVEQLSGTRWVPGSSTLTFSDRPGMSPARPPVSGNLRVSGFGWALSLAWLIMVVLPVAAQQTQPTTIDNAALIRYTDENTGDPVEKPTNTVRTPVTVPTRTPSVITFHKLTGTGGTDYPVDPTYYRQGADDGLWTDIGTPYDLGTPVSIPSTIALEETPLYYGGQPIFVKTRDIDQNLDSGVRETLVIVLRVAETGDEEILRLKETGPDTGEFIGFIQSQASPSPDYDGKLTVTNEAQINASYTDPVDGTDVSVAAALIDPLGTVFDSQTGEPVNGAKVRLVTALGQPAEVFGDDGTSPFPNEVISGGIVTAGSATYDFADGGFQFPLVRAGDYRLEVIPPPGYTAPSQVAIADLLLLGPFELNDGSYGNVFTVAVGPGFRVDIPLDPIPSGDLIVRKTANKSTVGIGEFIRYEVEVENSGDGPVLDVTLMDVLPKGFRYQEGSARRDGEKIANPDVAEDGRTLQLDVGDVPPNQTVKFNYVVLVGAGVRAGRAVNSAVAAAENGETSNVARAVVCVKDDLRGGCYILGRVMIQPKDGEETDEPRMGIPNARIYMEDGRYALTDKDGQYHFEGIRPGVHVVQLDVTTLPRGITPLGIKNTRFAGRAYSQFVDVQEGTLWRADFPVKQAPPVKPSLTVRGTAIPTDGKVMLRTTLSSLRGGVENVNYTIMLPPSLKVISDSVRVNGEKADAKIHGPAVVIAVGDLSADEEQVVSLNAVVDKGLVEGAVVKGMLTGKGSDGKGVPVPLLSIAIKENEETSGTVTAELPEPPEQSKTDSEELPFYENQGWLEKATPDFDWLLPTPQDPPAIGSMKVVIKHSANHQIRLLLNGEEVPPLCFSGRVRNSANTVAVSTWRRVKINEGANELTAVLMRGGEELSRETMNAFYAGPPTKAEVLTDQSVLIADGITVPVVTVRLTDKDGYPVRRMMQGEFTVAPPHQARNKMNDLAKHLPTGPMDGYARYTIGRNGVAKIELEPIPQAGEVTILIPVADGKTEEVKVWLEPVAREWILVGLAEGMVGYNHIEEELVAMDEDEAERHVYTNGRIAFFAKGKIKGKWLLTVAYDNKKEKECGPLGRSSLHQIIDPDAYYTLYGDESEQGFEAASRENLFIKLERGAFYAMFGDFETGLDVTELGKYSRSLTGGKTEYQGKRFSFNAFVSEAENGYMREEIRGNGTSGIYRLSGSDIVINSEKITLETRDRFHSEVVVNSQPMARHTDYEIDYEDGSIWFKRPVMSKDADLNPTYIVADYETDEGAPKSYIYGGRGAVKVTDQVEVGATYIHEGAHQADGDLYAADVTVDITPETQLRAEVARSDRTDAGEALQADAYLVELAHESQRLSGRAYYREQDEDFGLGQQNISERGVRKYGVEAAAKLTPKLTLGGEVTHRDNLETNAKQDVVEAELTWREGQFDYSLGGIYARDTFDDGETQVSEQIKTGVDWTSNEGRLHLYADHYQSVSQEDENSDYPTRTVLGADYLLTENTKVFGAFEHAWGSVRAQTFQAGIETTPWTGAKVGTSVAQDITENGNRTFANLGLSQTWQITDKWGVSAAMDSARIISDNTRQVDADTPLASGGDREDFTALSLGTSYLEEKWGFSTRFEYLFGETEDRLGFKAGVVGEVRPRLAMGLDLSIMNTDSDTGEDRLDIDLRHSLAYRPLDSEWIVLNRFDAIYEDVDGTDEGGDSLRFVNWLNANYLHNDHFQLSLRYACKYIVETYDSDEYSAYTDFTGIEARQDITERVDIGLRVAMLHTWGDDQISYSGGPSIGFSIVDNMWISLGYNVVGFYDEDFSKSDYTAQGAYLQFRMKFDQDTVKDLKKLITRK